jgi:hypothetical protein
MKFIDPDGRTVKPAKSLKGNKLQVFKSLRSSNSKYNELVWRYDNSSYSDRLHYRVGQSGRTSPSDRSYAHTQTGNDATSVHSSKRGYQALLSGTVTTNFVSDNTTEMSDIGTAATMIHEAVHAFILAEADFSQVNNSDHHIPFSEVMFNSTLEALEEYNTDTEGGFSNRDLMLLAANGLWGTKAVNEAFGIDPSSDDYDQQVTQLQKESKALIFNNKKND